MSTASASTSPASRTPRSIRRWLFLGSALVGVVGATFGAGCSHDWDPFDPRLGDGGAGGATGGTGGTTTTTGTDTGGGGAAGGAGGASTSVSSSSSGGGGTGGTGGTGGGPVKCGGTGVLADDFDAGDPGDVWDGGDWGNASLAQTGGEIVVTLPSNDSNEAGGYLVTERYYDLREDSVSVEVTSVPNPSAAGWASFWTGPSDENYVEIYEQKGTLQFGREINNTWASLKSIPYDPVAHRHWRFREDGVDTHWETSSDGEGWTSQVQVPTAGLFPLDLVQVVLAGGTDGGEPHPSPGEARFDHLNGGGAPRQKWCPISSITDDFADGMEGPQWARSWDDADGMLTEDSGELVLNFLPNNSAYAIYGSSSAFDLTGSALVLEVPLAPGSSSKSETGILLDAPGDNSIFMSKDQSQLELSFTAGGTQVEVASVLYSPTEHRWWRIREASGTLFWETSPDGKAWTIRAQQSPVPFPVEALDIEIGGGTYTAQPDPGISHFDNLNLPPP